MTTTKKTATRASAAPPSERRAHLVMLAGELFAEKGFRATTVREIADAAGILSGSLYHHFDSKESIGDEILSRLPQRRARRLPRRRRRQRRPACHASSRSCAPAPPRSPGTGPR